MTEMSPAEAVFFAAAALRPRNGQRTWPGHVQATTT